MPRLVASIFTAVALAFMGAASLAAWDQQRQLATFRPVPATVLSRDVQRQVTHNRRSRDSISYKPRITYRYEVAGRTYTSSNVAPLTDSGSETWARSVIGTYPPGPATAYYDPANPARAFLLPRPSFMPYPLILFASIFLTVAVGMFVLSDPAKPVPAPQRALRPAGWYELRPRRTSGDKMRAWFVLAAVWYGVGAAALGHYFTLARGRGPLDPSAIPLCALYALAGLVPLGTTIYFALLRRNAADARVLVDTDRFPPGKQFHVRVEQSLSRDLLVEKLQVCLACDATTKTRTGSKTTISTSTCYDQWATAMENQAASAGQVLSAEADLAVPDNQPGSSPDGFRDYPRYAWRISVHTSLAHSPDYRADFPIRVAGPAPQPA